MATQLEADGGKKSVDGKRAAAAKKRVIRDPEGGAEADDLGELNPILVYLQRIGDVRLLNRLGEQKVAQQIEEGTEQVFEALLAMPYGRRELLDAGKRLLEDVTYRCDVMETDDGYEFEDTSAMKELEKFEQQLQAARVAWEKAQKKARAKRPTAADQDAYRAAQRELYRLFREFGFGFRVLVKVLATIRQRADEMKRAQRQLSRMSSGTGLGAEALADAVRAGKAPRGVTATTLKRVGAIVETLDGVQRELGLDGQGLLDLIKQLDEGHAKAEQGARS